MKWLIRIGTHLAAGLVGFALGIYLLPILIAPESPGAQEVRLVAESARYQRPEGVQLGDRLVRIVQPIHHRGRVPVAPGSAPM